MSSSKICRINSKNTSAHPVMMLIERRHLKNFMSTLI